MGALHIFLDDDDDYDDDDDEFDDDRRSTYDCSVLSCHCCW